MCLCNVPLLTTIYEEEGFQIDQCPACGAFEPEALDLSAAEEAALELITYQRKMAEILRLEDEAEFGDDLFGSAVKASGY